MKATYNGYSNIFDKLFFFLEFLVQNAIYLYSGKHDNFETIYMSQISIIFYSHTAQCGKFCIYVYFSYI